MGGGGGAQALVEEVSWTSGPVSPWALRRFRGRCAVTSKASKTNCCDDGSGKSGSVLETSSPGDMSSLAGRECPWPALAEAKGGKGHFLYNWPWGLDSRWELGPVLAGNGGALLEWARPLGAANFEEGSLTFRTAVRPPGGHSSRPGKERSEGAPPAAS